MTRPLQPPEGQGALGILVALPEEARCLGLRPAGPGLHSLGQDVLVAVSGVGPRRAAAAASALLERGARGLLSFGTAGALDPRLRPGDVLVPGVVTDAQGRERATAAAWSARLRDSVAPGGTDGVRLLSVTEVIGSPADKRRLHAASAAHAVDMESMAVAEVAGAHAALFAAVRVVVDAAEHCVPQAALEATGEDGTVSLRRLLLGLAREPGQIAPLLRLMVSFRAASAGLRRTSAATGGRFAWDGGRPGLEGPGGR